MTEFVMNAAIKNMDNKYKHVLEFGVATGTSLKYIKNNISSNYKIFGFDSFEGLPEDWEGTSCKKGTFSTYGKVPEISDVTFFKGWFSDTIPQYKLIASPISLLHIDCDLYSSCKEILYGLNEFILPNTIIVFDEWYFEKSIKFNYCEQKCFYEWSVDFGVSSEFIFPDEYRRMEDPITENRIVKILWKK